MVFFCCDISVVLFHTLGFFRCHNTFLLSPPLCLIIIRKPSCGPNVLVVLNPPAEAKGEGLDPLKHV